MARSHSGSTDVGQPTLPKIIDIHKNFPFDVPDRLFLHCFEKRLRCANAPNTTIQLVRILREHGMTSRGKSLREMVAHWLNPDSSMPVRVIRYRSGWANRQLYVQVETRKSQGPVAMYFFRHEDGAWRVFPPRRESPAMRVVQEDCWKNLL